jgi:TolB-like protein/DNA-binding SARP family transcriptional activator/Flp pilus assembly protein TadD
MSLRVNLFGAASIEVDGVPVTGRAAQGRRLALLAVLACARGRTLGRDKILGLLWPESPADRGRRQLSDDVYLLRRALGEDVLRSVGDDLALDLEALTSDVAAFERLLDEGALDEAVGLFVGPLLDGFHLSDGAEFERWLDAERVRLGQRYASALQGLAEAAEDRDDFVVAADWWRKLAAHDPYSGRISQRLMRALEAAGDRVGALRHARVHAALMRAEFDAGPDPEVAALAERLRTDDGAADLRRPAVSTAEPRPRAGAESPGEAEEISPLSGDLAPVVDPAGGAGVDPRAAPGLEADIRPVAEGRAPAPRGWGASRIAAAAAAVLALALLAGLAAAGLRGRTASRVEASEAAASVGVLPFVNMSADPENTYFSDGLSEQIIAVLSRIEGLRVAARTSSFALRGGEMDVRAIGDTLGVAAVLEGSVRRDGNRLRVTAQLIDAQTGYHLWSDEYDRELEDVFAVQEEIAQAIARALGPRLAAGGMPTAPRPSVDLEAYDLYLRGLSLRNDLTADALREARACFDRAIALDPDFALAYAAQASVVAPAILFGYMPAEEGTAELRRLTTRALALDPTLGEAHAALGVLRLFFDWDWTGAEESLRRAVALNPNDAHAYHHLANYLQAMRRPSEAVSVRARAVELDPLNARTIMLLASDHLATGDTERALDLFRRALRLDPAHPLLLGAGPWLPNGPAEVYRRQGRNEEAVEEYARIATLRGASAAEVTALRDAFAASGMPGFWRSWHEMDIRQSGGRLDPLRMASLAALSGDTARAWDWLDRAYAERNHGLIMLRHNVALRPWLSHPRVARIVDAMRFPAS